MSDIIADGKPWQKKKYMCMSCHRICNLDKFTFLEKDGKCDKCGGKLVDTDPRVH